MAQDKRFRYGKHLGEVLEIAAPVTVFKIPLPMLVDRPDSEGMNKQEFTGLVADIREKGLLNPIIVMPCASCAKPGGTFDIEHHGKYSVIAGHNRVRAYQLLGFDEIDCIIWDRPGVHCDCSQLKSIIPFIW